jgi:HlyD family secretion protein
MDRESSQRGNAAAELHDWPDEVLLAEYVYTHDERLLSEIVERHEGMVLAVCRGVLHHRQDVEDAAQQTWLVLLRKAASILKGASLESWLHGAALGEAKNIRKSKKRHEKHESLKAQVAPSGDGTESGETLETVNTEVQRLPEKLRVPFVLHCLEGKSKREISQQLGLKESTVAGRVATARKLLRQRLVQRGVALPSKS